MTRVPTTLVLALAIFALVVSLAAVDAGTHKSAHPSANNKAIRQAHLQRRALYDLAAFAW